MESFTRLDNGDGKRHTTNYHLECGVKIGQLRHYACSKPGEPQPPSQDHTSTAIVDLINENGLTYILITPNPFRAGTVFIRQSLGGGPMVVVSTAASHARIRGSVPGLGGLKEAKCFFPIHV